MLVVVPSLLLLHIPQSWNYLLSLQVSFLNFQLQLRPNFKHIIIWKLLMFLTAKTKKVINETKWDIKKYLSLSIGETWPALEQYQAELVENFFINILQLCPDTMKLQREGFQRKKFLEFSKLVLTHITKAWRLTVETLKWIFLHS